MGFRASGLQGFRASFVLLSRKLKYRFRILLRKIYSAINIRSRSFILEDAITCTENQIEFISTTTHIIHYDNGLQKGYLRVCRFHEEKYKYLLRIVDDYIRLKLKDGHAKEFRAIIAEKLSGKKNLRKFFRMGMPWGLKYPDSVSPYAEFLEFRNASVIGIDGDIPEWLADILPDFARFARFPVYDYLYNEHLRYGQYHTYFSGKAKAYKVFAGLVGVSFLVPDSRYICLKHGDAVSAGISVSPAEGVSTYSLRAGNVTVLPALQRELAMLGMIDAVCGHRDHDPRNYFVRTDNEGRICGISVFDNDDPSAFAAVPSFRFGKTDSFAPYLDRDSSMRIMSLTRGELYASLSPHLSGLEVFMLYVRVRRLVRALKKSLMAGKTRLLGQDEWSCGTIREELEGEYGMTYLKQFALKYGIHIPQS